MIDNEEYHKTSLGNNKKTFPCYLKFYNCNLRHNFLYNVFKFLTICALKFKPECSVQVVGSQEIDVSTIVFSLNTISY